MTMTLTDGNAFSNTDIKHVDTFIYSRKYGSTSWVTTVLPVALNYSDWSDNFDIANITGVNLRLDANKLIQSFTVNMSILKAGSNTNPNLPYLIRAKVANTNTYLNIKKTNCDVYPATPKELVFTSGDYKITFKGTYKKLTSNIYTSSKEIWSPGTSVGPYRVYASVLKKEQEVSPDPASDGDIYPEVLRTEYEQLQVFVTSTYTQLSNQIRDLLRRINNLEANILNTSQEDSSSNSQYEQRISLLETKLGKVHFEVTP